MVIKNSDVHMESQHLFFKEEVSNERLRFWRGGEEVEMSRRREAAALQLSVEVQDRVNISTSGWQKYMQSLQKQMQQTTLKKNALEADESLSPGLYLIKMLLKKVFGIDIEIGGGEGKPAATTGQVPANQAGSGRQMQGWGIEYSYYEKKVEKEAVNFSASGKITTGKNEKIDFEVKMEMSREKFEEVSINLKGGDAQIDPLALNLDGGVIGLSDSKIKFDLNLDGKMENISFLKSGSGFLVFDKNGNGAVDDGGELFGPSTNNGFEELRQYDDDGNEWIDEQDSIYQKLGVWTQAGDGTLALSSLQQQQVGAIYLSKVQTPFDLGEGQLRETGVYLSETGTARTISEVDLRTEA